MRYETVLFDLDGTLLNTIEDLKNAVNHQLAAAGYPQRTLEEVRSFVGNGLRMLMKRALPCTCSEEEVSGHTAAMREYYYDHAAEATRPYPGIAAVLAQLKESGTAVGVVSNKADEAVKRLCEIYFPGLVSVATGEMEGLPRKPAPDTVELTLRAMGRGKEHAVYVGDSEVDLATAKNAGLPCIALSWGFRGRAALEAAGAEKIVDTAEELLAALR